MDNVPIGAAPDAEPAAPNRLFHYTTQQTFVKIIESKEVWATRMSFLSDATEISLTVDLALEELDRMISRNKCSMFTPDVCTSVRDWLARLRDMNFFSFSFSEIPDLLSQWRGYCAAGTGYSVVFDGALLKKIASSQGKRAFTLGMTGRSEGFELVKCVYEQPKQLGQIRMVIAAAIKHTVASMNLSPKPDYAELVDRVGYRFAERLLQHAQSFKHQTFSEEREWRLISPPIGDDDPSVGYRLGQHTLIPYCRVAVATPDDCAIRGTWLGPNPHSKLAAHSAFLFLLRNGIKIPEVHTSKIPFRPL
ncbi:MAG: hypothetical protein QOG12_1984 [Verrucomicrobiota bacterium]